MTKYRVTLTVEEREELAQMLGRGKAAAALKLAHARVLLQADASPGGPGGSDARVVEAVGVGKNTVCRVRERFVEQGLAAALARKPAGRTYARKLDGRGEAHLVAPACPAPPEGRGRWTMQLLADRVVAPGHAEALSDETVRRVLKKTRPSRGRGRCGACRRPAPTARSSRAWRTCRTCTTARATRSGRR